MNDGVCDGLAARPMFQPMPGSVSGKKWEMISHFYWLPKMEHNLPFLSDIVSDFYRFQKCQMI
jgi:hypothetical protein